MNKRMLYLNGSKWAYLGPQRDMRWLIACLYIALFVCGK
jgi:hypothetical protein